MAQTAYNTATVERVLDWVRSHPLEDGRPVPVCIWGDRGVGKTQLLRSYCSKNELGIRVFHPAHNNTGSDLIGLPQIEEESGRTVYATPKWLPSAQDALVWEREGLIFIDEINRSPKAVLDGLLEPIGEGTIKQTGWELPGGWSFVCAANPPRAGYDVEHLDEALMDRMLHIALGFDSVRWASWATSSGISEDMVGFMARFPGMMAEAEADLPEEIEIKATPRSLEYLSRLYEPDMDRGLLHVLARGLIGPTAAEALVQHLSGGDRPVSAEEVFSGNDYQQRLQAHVAAGRVDLLDSSQTMLVAMLARFQPGRADGQLSPEGVQQVQQILAYMQIVGAERAQKLINGIHAQAKHWIEPLEQAAGRRLEARA